MIPFKDKDETENVSEPNATGSVSGMSNQNDINVLPTPDVDTSTSGPGGQLSNSVPSDHPTFDGCLMLQENQMVPNYDQDIADLAYMQSFEVLNGHPNHEVIHKNPFHSCNLHHRLL